MAPKVSEAYKEEKRAALIESSLQCFAEKGFQATTIDDIALHAGSSKGAIYNYFSSKEQIYLEVMAESSKSFFDDLKERFRTLNSATAKIRCVLDIFKQPLSEDEQKSLRVQTEFWLYCLRQDDLKVLMEKRYETFLAFIEEIIEEGKRSGEFRPEIEPRTVASLLWALRDGSGKQFLVLKENDNYMNLWQVAEESLLSYLK